MKERLISLLIPRLARTKLYAIYILTRHSYLEEWGWFKSAKSRRPVSRDGEPLPWMVYPMISFLEPRLKPDFEVFEYGCGNSTLWWSKRVNRIVACEHDRRWMEDVQQSAESNIFLRHRDLGNNYAACIREHEERFDIVLVDGRERVDCMKNAMSALTAGGVIILDNSEVEEYRPGIDYLLSHGFKELRFDGPGPILSSGWSTSIFYRERNCLQI